MGIFINVYLVRVLIICYNITVMNLLYFGLVMEMSVENYLQNKLEEWGEEGVQKFIELYSSVESERLRKLFSKSHYEVNNLFQYLNQRLQNGHYNAAQSRELIDWIERIEELQPQLI